MIGLNWIGYVKKFTQIQFIKIWLDWIIDLVKSNQWIPLIKNVDFYVWYECFNNHFYESNIYGNLFLIKFFTKKSM